MLSSFVQRAKAPVKDQVSHVQQVCRSRLRAARQVAQTLHRQLRRKDEEKEAEQKELDQKLLQTADLSRIPAPLHATKLGRWWSLVGTSSWMKWMGAS